MRDSDLWTMVLSFAFVAALVAFCMATEFAVRHTMERLTAGARGGVVDEDDLWLWGMFYNNPGDRHLFVNDRTGSGMGVNIGRTGGKLIVIGTAVILIGLAVFGVTMAAGFDAPREGYIEGDTLYFQHFSEKYEIDLDEVEGVELLDELPEARRIAGTGMSTLLEGTLHRGRLRKRAHQPQSAVAAVHSGGDRGTCRASSRWRRPRRPRRFTARSWRQ